MAATTMTSERIDADAPKAASANAMLVVDDIVKRFETPDGVLVAVVDVRVEPGYTPAMTAAVSNAERKA